MDLPVSNPQCYLILDDGSTLKGEESICLEWRTLHLNTVRLKKKKQEEAEMRESSYCNDCGLCTVGETII